MAITASNVFAVPTSDGTIALTLENFSPNNPEVAGPPHEPATVDRVGWVVQRNGADALKGVNPGITPILRTR